MPRKRLRTALVAEDTKVTRILCSETLRDRGVEVYEAKDGREAVDLALRRRPQLLLLDGLMPVYTAFDVLARLRATAPDYTPTVFIFTALYKSRRWESEARTSFNVAEYLEKPLEPETLITVARGYFDL